MVRNALNDDSITSMVEKNGFCTDIMNEDFKNSTKC